MELPITVNEHDLLEFAGSISNTKDDMVYIIFERENIGVNRIVLRTILKCYGEQYHIVSEKEEVVELTDGTEIVYVNITTNLPMDLVDKVYGF